MSANIKSVEEFLKSKNVKYVSSCSLIEDEDTLIVNIPIDFISSGVTTVRKIENLKKSIADRFDIKVIDSVVHSEKSNKIQYGITSIVDREVSSSNYEISLILQAAGEFLVFIEFKDVVDPEKISKINDDLNRYFDILQINKFNIEFIRKSQNPPTLTAILRSAKKIAPFLVKDIVKDLELRGFDLPSEKWMDKQLDLARKKGLILRRQDEKYALTYKGVLATPIAKNRNSSDVERVLYLASKKW